MDFIFLKDLSTIIGSLIVILTAIVGITVWMIKTSFKKGEAYQLFKHLVEQVHRISNVMDKEFTENNKQHKEFEHDLQDHDKRITTLEIVKNVKK